MKNLHACIALVVTLAAPPVAAAESAEVKYGRYLVLSNGCADCHTPMRQTPTEPQPDPAMTLAGHPEKILPPPPPPLNDLWNNAGFWTSTAYAGPWGISFSANLTPDRETGIGAWREQDFVNTIRKGKHLGVGRPLLPPMPWETFAHMTDRDLKAIFAYLRTVPPVHNRVPANQPPPSKP